MFAPKKCPPEGWTTCHHPEGARYFFHEQKRVFTDANLFDPATLVFINDNVYTVDDFLLAHHVDLPPGVDLVLNEHVLSDGRKTCKYYFANHLGRRLFWMDIGDSCLRVEGMTSIGHELEAQYWLHCEYYPRAFELTDEIVDELRGNVQYALGDVVTSKIPTIIWKLDELNNMIALIDGFTKNVGRDAEQKFRGSNCLVGRLMHRFARHRAYHFHGEPGARLTVNQSVPKRSMFNRLVNLLLFNAPKSHLSRWRAVSTPGLIHGRLEQSMERFVNEWKESVINAAVVLNANVAFLSIQNVGLLAQIASYVSTTLSIMSTALGLVVLNFHYNRGSNTAAASSASHFNETFSMRHLEAVAVLYSFPYAMRIWSMLFFVLAFCFMGTQNFFAGSFIVGVLLVLITLLLLLALYIRSGSRDLVRDSKAKKWRRVVSWPIAIFRKMYNSDRSVPNV
ncbi:hypothetical protein C8R45DRAFT_402828 [Mycena sanguinolenta]|nr:hypothetical protein C8R45DRAFT_402828 [Mycena sanguinolenta]